MNKSELVEALANGSGITKAAANRVLQTFTQTVADVIKSGDRLDITGFGSFSKSERAERVGRNPQTGLEIKIKACSVPKFKAGKALREAVQ